MSSSQDKIISLKNMHSLLSNYAATYSARLDRARVDKQRVDKLLSISVQLNELELEIGYMCASLKELNKLARNKEIDYKKSRLSFLDAKITVGLGLIFPTKHLSAKTECNFSRSNLKLQLRLTDSNGNTRPPFITEGKLNQQLISFLSATCCCELLGSKQLFLDEAFSNSSEGNLTKIQEILRDLLDDGVQIFMISHSSLIFSDLPRRIIRLGATANGFVEQCTTTDYS